MDLSALFGQETVNPLAIVERVFQQVVDQLARTEGVADTDGSPPDELIAVALGNRLARMIVDDQSSGSADWHGLDRSQDDLAFDELVDRNLALAAALGACDCWGQESGCPVCDGAGGPGWLPPDRQLFAAYVYPAMRAVARTGGLPNGAARRNNNHHKEDGYVGNHAR
jgi:hypothetical protein